jgi:hypothetical protein
VASIKPMVGWDTVTDICRDKGGLAASRPLPRLG